MSERFGCSQCGAGEDRVALRGRTKKGAQYRCLSCDHIGHSNHPDLVVKEEREKPPPPIKFEAHMPVHAYDSHRCNDDCDGYGYDGEGDPVCQYWGEYLEYAAGPPCGRFSLFKRCRQCIEEEEKRTQVRAGG